MVWLGQACAAALDSKGCQHNGQLPDPAVSCSSDWEKTGRLGAQFHLRKIAEESQFVNPEWPDALAGRLRGLTAG